MKRKNFASKFSVVSFLVFLFFFVSGLIALGYKVAHADIPAVSGYATATATNPTSSLTDFSFIVNLANMPASWWSAVDTTDPTKGRAAKNDGTELPADWLSFNNVAKTGYVRIKWTGSLANSGSQIVRIYPPKSTNSSYALSATYGGYNAYDASWAGYWPDGATTDRTVNANNGSIGVDILAGNSTGPAGIATQYYNTANSYSTLPANASLNITGNITILAMANASTISTYDVIIGGWSSAGGFPGYGFTPSATNALSSWNGSAFAATANNVWNTGSWYGIGYTNDNSTDTFFVNGSSVGTATGRANPSSYSGTRLIGAANNTGGPQLQYVGYLQHVEIHSTNRSAPWVAEEYSQLGNNTSFWGTWTWNTPPTVPGTPTGASAATSSPNQATISFTPGSTGGSSILYYLASSTPGNFLGTSSGSPITVTGLTNGTAYTFAVYAVNGVGTSTPSSATSAVTPTAAAVAPTLTTSAPTLVATSTFTLNANVSATGGASITQSGFAYGTNANLTTVIATTTLGAQSVGSFTQNLTGLTPNTVYYFRAYATNSVGTSVGSILSTTTIATTVPGSPTGITAATTTPNQATVTFSAPTNIGNSGILYYVASSTPGNFTATSTGSPITVTGLTNGTAYTFAVYAVNGVGTSTPSIASNAVTPTATPVFQSTFISTDGNNVMTYYVSSIYDGPGTTTLRILQPTSPAAGVAHNFLWCLPVSADGVTTYGDCVDQVRLLGVPNQYNVTIIAPSFSIPPWFADSDSLTYYKYETYMVTQLYPWVQANFQTSGIEQNWLIGFSKSGHGGLDLLFRHPDLFSLGAFWDFPGAMTQYDTYEGGASNYGDQANFANNYELTSSFLSNWKTPFLTDNRIWINGYGNFQTDVEAFDTAITSQGILHTTAAEVSRAHLWSSGWIAPAVAALYSKSLATSTITNISVATSTPSQATVSWTTNDFANSQVDYGLSSSYTSTTVLNTATTTSHSVTITGLSTSTVYHYRVRSTNFLNNLATSTDHTFTTSAILTAPSLTTTAETSVGTSTATFNANVSATGGASITQSGFAYGTNANLTTVIATTTLGSQSTGTFSQNLTGLAPNTTYYFRAYAVNSIGTSTGSIVSTTTLPWAVAGAPTGVTAATSTPNQATISFTAPVSNGGSSIVYYYASSTPGNFSGVSSGSPITITGLSNGTAYTFAVYAVNLVGTSTPSSASNAVTPIPAPTAPTLTTSAATSIASSSLTLNSTISAINGAAITQSGFAYGTNASLASVIATTTLGAQAGAGSFSQNISSLTPNTTYYFRAYATNSVGTSMGTIVSAGTLQWAVAGAPTGVSAATTTPNQATVTFTAPASTGGSPILYYVASSTPGNIIATSTASPIIVSGLTNATTYTFAVYAVNAVGTSSPSSASSAVTPIADVTPPNILSFSSGSPTTSGTTITWTTNEVSDSQIAYGLTSSYGSITSLDSNLVTNHSENLSGLLAGTVYHYQIISKDPSNNVGSTTDQTFSTAAQSSGGSSSSSSSGGGGGGGGGGAITPITPVVPTVAPTIPTVPAATPVSVTFARNLTVNSAGNDVKNLQTFLIAGGFLKAGYNTGVFGLLTQAALAKYQAAKGIYPAAGYFGPTTRAAITNVKAPTVPVAHVTPVTPAVTPPASAAIPPFARNLTIGANGNDVYRLQVYLNSHGYPVASSGVGSQGHETHDFQYATQAALARFQDANEIVPANGYFGPKTRDAINATL